MVNKRVQNAVFECNLKNDSVFRLYQMVNTEIRLIMFFVAKDGMTKQLKNKNPQQGFAAAVL